MNMENAIFLRVLMSVTDLRLVDDLVGEIFVELPQKSDVMRPA